MKTSKNRLTILLFAFTIVASQGCKDYFDLNDNPNLVTKPPINAMLTTATQKTGLNNQRFANFINYYTQYFASPGASGISDTYQISNNTSQWDNAYFAMADIYDMKQEAIVAESSEHLGVANILMAFNLNLIIDTWGTGPYSEAFVKEILAPQYDSQEALYNESVKLVSEGIIELSKTDSKVKLGTSEDIIHGGSRVAWLKTAYALQARILNKISKKSSYNAAAVLSAIDNAYQTNADDAEMNVFAVRNPWSQAAINNIGKTLDGWLSDNLINQLNGTTYGLFDPRIEKITDKTVNGVYVGTRNGTGNLGGDNTVWDECYVSLNSPWSSEEAPLIIISYAELKFIEAEAALSTNPTRAYDAYLKGIKANMDKFKVEATKAAAYINDPSISVGAGNLTKDLIFKEKYVATYLNPEAWNDLRRHDYQYKNFRLPVNAVLPTFIRQVAFPDGERTKNGINVPTDVTLDTHLWWDQP